MKKHNYVKDTSGITLVALVITIIIILLLVGVTIAIAFRREWINWEGKGSSRTIFSRAI